MLCSDFRRLVAVALVLTTTFITLPMSAADFSTLRPVIGSVSAIGSVDLRGVGISRDGTLFAGDSIRSHEKGYAKVILGTDSKIELTEKTGITVNRDAQGMKIAMNDGTIGFTTKSPLRVDVMPFEFTASDEASGNVAVMSSTTAGVRVTSGKVSVRNLKTSESFVLTKGQEQLFGLQNGVHAKPLAEVASNMPLPVPAPGSPAPAPAPQVPAGRTSNPGLAMDAGGWLAVIGVGAITGVAIWAIVEARNNHDDIESQHNQQNCNANLSAISSSVSQQSSALALASSLAGQAQLALLAAGNTAGAAQFQSLQTQITTTLNSLNALQLKIQSAQGSACSNATVASLLSQEEALRSQTNSLLSQLMNLLNTFRTINGVPNPVNVPNPIGGPPIASPSVPA
jgi:hypothetical protein